jgi:NADP-dependent 3-hydroxy acid dehydrogenase YdfG
MGRREQVARGSSVRDAIEAPVASRQGLRRFCRIGSLVNNAGVLIAKPFMEYVEADFTNILATNVAGTQREGNVTSPAS